MGKKRGRLAKKNKREANTEPEHLTRAPHSFVFHRGSVGKYVQALVKDVRRVMDPFTASQLKVRRRNSIKDLVAVSGPLHVSHMLMFTLTEVCPYLRIGRLPRGPTLTFKIHSYVLTKDVASSLKRQYDDPLLYTNAPLVVLNGFQQSKEEGKLMIATLQGMFPTINVAKVSLGTIRRCVLFNYDPLSKLIEMRHYFISVRPVGLTKSVKRIVSKKVPNLGRFDDIADFVDKADLLSESEAEDDPNSHVVLPQKVMSKRGNMEGSKSAIRLHELGPRITFQLIKVESGLLDGEVLFHEFIQKTEEEKAEIEKRREERKKLKLKRQLEQRRNVKMKEMEKERLKLKSLEGMKKKRGETESDILMKEAVEEGALQEDDDDADWYRKEVGAEPDSDLFQDPNSSLKRKRDSNFKAVKMPKTRFRQKTPRDSKKESRERNRGNTHSAGSKDRPHKPNDKWSGSKRRMGTKVVKGKRVR